MYAALTIETADKIYSFPLPESGTTTNYPGSNGLKYEAIEVRKCIQNGMHYVLFGTKCSGNR